jgi:flagellin
MVSTVLQTGWHSKKIKAEISRIATTTQAGGVKILAGKYSSTFLVGANAGQRISINISRTGGGYGAFGLSLATISIATLADAR